MAVDLMAALGRPAKEAGTTAEEDWESAALAVDMVPRVEVRESEVQVARLSCNSKSMLHQIG